MNIKQVVEKIIDKINLLEKVYVEVDKIREDIGNKFNKALTKSKNASNKASVWSGRTSIDTISWNSGVSFSRDGLCLVNITPSATTGWLTIQEGGSGGMEVVKIPRFWISGNNNHISTVFPVRKGRTYYFYGASASKITYRIYYL